jgi:diguanylate cyclase (GGDEF)-like protein
MVTATIPPHASGLIRRVLSSGSTHAWFVVIAISVADLSLYPHLAITRAPFASPHIPWLVLCLACILAGHFAVSAVIGDQVSETQHTEAFIGLAFMFCTPPEVLLFIGVCAFVSQAILRAEPVRFIFNVVHELFALELGLLILNSLVDPFHLDAPRSVLGLALALFAYLATSLTTIVVLIACTHELDLRTRLYHLRIATIESVLGSCFGTSAALLLLVGPLPLLLFMVPCATLLYFFRVYYARQEQQRQLLELHKLTLSLLTASNLALAAGDYLRHASTIFGADTAVLALLPSGRAETNAVHMTVFRRGTFILEGVSTTLDAPSAVLLSRLVDTSVVRFHHTELATASSFQAQHEMKSGFAALLGSPDKPLGILALGHSLPKHPSFESRAQLLIETLANQTTIAFERSRLSTSLETMATERVGLVQRAFHDALTGLPNRALFNQRAEQAVASIHPPGHVVGIIFLDLDGFKKANDTLGHGAGDELLIEVGRRLQALIRDHDTAARFGGDEFAILLEEIPSPEIAQTIAGRIVESLRTPIATTAGEANVRASVGMVIAADTARSAKELMAAADAAMYEAKRAGKDRYIIAESLEKGHQC